MHCKLVGHKQMQSQYERRKYNVQSLGPSGTKGPTKAITIMAVYNQHNASEWLYTPSKGLATSTGCHFD